VGLARLGAAEYGKSNSGKTGGTGAASIRVSIIAFRKEGQIHERGLTMSAESRGPEPQFENPEVSKLEDETNEDGSARKQMDREAEKLARKSTKVEQDSGKDRSIFTK
jgi:hypothetical protein